LLRAFLEGIVACIRDVAAGVGTISGTRVTVDYNRYYPATINDPEAASEALAIAAAVMKAELAPDPAFTSEDFAFMLQECRGAYLWLGQGRGDQGAPLHHPHYDFNDDVLGDGVRLHVALATHFLSAQAPG
jgi:hippurate hydrolase